MSLRKKSRSKQGVSKDAKAVSSKKGAVDTEVYPMREAVYRLEAVLIARKQTATGARCARCGCAPPIAQNAARRSMLTMRKSAPGWRGGIGPMRRNNPPKIGGAMSQRKTKRGCESAASG